MNSDFGGADEIEIELKRREEETKRYKEGNLRPKIQRFWMKQNTDVELTFVDDDTKALPNGKFPPLTFREHQIYLNGNWFNFFRCLIQNCPICQQNNKSYFAGLYTVIDPTPWTDRDGIIHKDILKLYVAKLDNLQKLRYISQKMGGLRGLKIGIQRGSKDLNTGGQFMPGNRIQLPPEIQPFDYPSILPLKSRDELLTILGQQSHQTSIQTQQPEIVTYQDDMDDDIPF